MKNQVINKCQKIEEQGVNLNDISPKKHEDESIEKEIEQFKKLEQELEKVTKSTVHVSKEQIEDAKAFLKTMGQVVVQAHSEGEATCAVMN